MKGAPERIYSRCSTILINGQEVNINKAHDESFEQANKFFGGQGEWVLAFARLYLDEKDYPRNFDFNMQKDSYNFPMQNLCLIGLISLNDPPKRFVAHSVTKCRWAGIKVIMVTGDQPVTAAAIAKKVNIITPDDPNVIVNVDLIEKGMSPAEAFDKCTAVVVHGDDLAIQSAMESMLDDNDPEKNKFLINYIWKEEVVFARTTPS